MKKEIGNLLFSALKTRWWLVGEQDTIRYKILRDCTETCCYLPKPIRKRVFSILNDFVLILSRFFSILSQMSLIAYQVSGKEKHGRGNLTILFIGDEPIFPYISSILFSEEPKIEKYFNIHLWNYKKKINQIHSDINAVFIKSDRFYSSFFEKQGYKVIPKWISATLDISEPLENVYKKFSKSAKEDIRKIKKYSYTYEISQDPDKLNLFYYKMYLPYISSRYGKFGKCLNFYSIKHYFERGSKILFIKLDNEYMFGGLFLKKKDKVYASYAGVMEGKFDYIKKGVIAGSYYYLIQHSKKIGANLIDFGFCKPFVNDGLFSYKRKWGTRIEKTGNENTEIYSFKVLNENKGIRNFLTNNPFISLEKNQINTEACAQ
jgi:hypothetical protein